MDWIGISCHVERMILEVHDLKLLLSECLLMIYVDQGGHLWFLRRTIGAALETLQICHDDEDGIWLKPHGRDYRPAHA
jgi:hypothetical protein